MSIISVKQLSKQYRLKHEAQRYRSLRDEMAAAAKNLISLKALRGGNTSGNTVEEFWALKDVNFEVNQGDRLAIIGRNGAGKSTLLKILSRITDPTQGRVEITGRVSSLLEVGTGFHPELSGRENIFLNGAILGMTSEEVRKKFDQIVAFAEVERFLDTPVKRYSSGMYVRLAFAVAAHLEPDVLVVDEVLAVGDAQFQQKCLGRMGELSQSGRTIIFVTHNMDAMLSLCNRGLVLERGSVVFDGSPSEARKKYLAKAESAEYSVQSNAGRGGSGGAEIVNVSVRAADNADGIIKSGEPLSISMEATVNRDLQFRADLQVAFGIDTIEGQRLYTVLSSWDEAKVELRDGNISIACDIASLPLVPGQYLISATVLFQGDTLDSIQHCATFDVLPRERKSHVERIYGWGNLDLTSSFRNLY
jgi:lipopolysaccharide transport system ATP-binding protein